MIEQHQGSGWKCVGYALMLSMCGVGFAALALGESLGFFPTMILLAIVGVFSLVLCYQHYMANVAHNYARHAAALVGQEPPSGDWILRKQAEPDGGYAWDEPFYWFETVPVTDELAVVEEQRRLKFTFAVTDELAVAESHPPCTLNALVPLSWGRDGDHDRRVCTHNGEHDWAWKGVSYCGDCGKELPAGWESVCFPS